MNIIKLPSVMLISGIPGTGQMTIARKILQTNSEYIVIEQVDII